MRWTVGCLIALLAAALGGGGCAQTHSVTFTARPADAKIAVNDLPGRTGPVTHEFQFRSNTEVHRVVASRPGYKDAVAEITSADDRSNIHLQLEPESRNVTFDVSPVPAIVSVNGDMLSVFPVSRITKELPFPPDEQGNRPVYTVNASAKGFQNATAQVTWTDRRDVVNLTLRPMTKAVRVTTEPAEARVFIDGEDRGFSPVTIDALPFEYDPATGQYREHRVRVQKTGFKEVESAIKWQDRSTDYVIRLDARSKQVRIHTDPSGGVVRIAGSDVKPDPTGVATINLSFGLDAAGRSPTYTAVAVKAADGREWQGKTTIAWEPRDQTDYTIKMTEIRTKDVPFVSWEPERDPAGRWRIVPRRGTLRAMRDRTEGPGRVSPFRITTLGASAQIDGLWVAPDGGNIVFNTLGGTTDPGVLRSQMFILQADGLAEARALTDGRTLDVAPSFTPDGKSVVFSSDRGGKGVGLWTLPADGSAAPQAIATGGAGMSLWPVVDSAPQPRVFFSAFADGQAQPQLARVPLGEAKRTDLAGAQGMQPRVSPTGDFVLFTAPHAETGKHDIFRVPAEGGAVENLTATPAVDERDPAWSFDGSQVAFAADRETAEGDEADNPEPQYDIWTMDMRAPGQPRRVTFNGSRDDRPSWDPIADAIYFRSNRGGEWNVWKIELK